MFLECQCVIGISVSSWNHCTSILANASLYFWFLFFSIQHFINPLSLFSPPLSIIWCILIARSKTTVLSQRLERSATFSWSFFVSVEANRFLWSYTMDKLTILNILVVACIKNTEWQYLLVYVYVYFTFVWYLNSVVLCKSQQVNAHPMITTLSTTNIRPSAIPSPIAS